MSEEKHTTWETEEMFYRLVIGSNPNVSNPHQVQGRQKKHSDMGWLYCRGVSDYEALCLNSHEALLSSLKDLLHHFCGGGERTMTDAQVQEKALKAISLAEATTNPQSDEAAQEGKE